MKKIWFLISLLLCCGLVSAVDVDVQIEEALNKQQQEEMMQQAKDLTENFSFTQVNSCASMETVVGEFLELYKKYYPQRNYRYPYYDGGLMVNGAMTIDFAMLANDGMMDDAVKEMSVVDSIQAMVPAVWGGGEDYSTTNLQKVGVDEPETLKSNGEYLFYYVPYDQSGKSYVSIIKTPTQSDLQDAEIVTKINIPKSLSNVQLFLQGDTLIIIASRYTNYSTASVLGSAHSVVIVYDISDINNLTLEKMVNVNGSFLDARVIDGQLYLISQMYLDWYRFAYDDPIIPLDDILPVTTQFYLKDALEISETDTASKMYVREKTTLPCSSTFYLFPSEESLKEYGVLPNFTLVSKIALDSSKKVEQKLVFGTVEDIHMSKDTLYLPSPIYFSSPMKCPDTARCRRPSYSAGQHTLVHKMSLGSTISYKDKDSKIIPGVPLSQYSMDEDSQGNFRILTKTWYPNLATQFFVFDKDFNLAGSLLDIEPGEEFKSSRYIGDKLYLVTFQQIDPLFVVDVADIKHPKIVGELKIPWYSTYLHPYDTLKNGIQYLVGLGYSTKTNQRWGVTNENVKLDLYEIDFNQRETVATKCASLITPEVDPNATNLCLKSSASCSLDQLVYEDCVAAVNPENIAVSLLASHEFGGDVSYSPSLYNPRMFVWNNAKKDLLMPLFAYINQEVTQVWRNGQTWQSTEYRPLFAGAKGLHVSTDKGFTEIISQNFAALATADNYYSDQNQGARVGYIGEVSYFLKGGFVSFFNGNKKVEIGVY